MPNNTEYTNGNHSVILLLHICSVMHGQTTVDAIFGKESDIFSLRSKLPVCSEFEQYFDSGEIVIVPDVNTRITNRL